MYANLAGKTLQAKSRLPESFAQVESFSGESLVLSVLLGIAAALHAAAAVKPDRPCGLATLDRFDRHNPLTAVGGHMHVPAGPGLGDGLLSWYAE